MLSSYCLNAMGGPCRDVGPPQMDGTHPIAFVLMHSAELPRKKHNNKVCKTSRIQVLEFWFNRREFPVALNGPSTSSKKTKKPHLNRKVFLLGFEKERHQADSITVFKCPLEWISKVATQEKQHKVGMKTATGCLSLGLGKLFCFF